MEILTSCLDLITYVLGFFVSEPFLAILFWSFLLFVLTMGVVRMCFDL